MKDDATIPQESATSGQEVRRRRVFYIPGYDPFPPRRYRELYRTESKAQAEISGYDVSLRSARREPDGRESDSLGSTDRGQFGWQVESAMDGARVTADFNVLVWSDIVRSSMGHGIVATYIAMVRTAWVYIASGALWRLMRLRKGPVIAALYPVGMLIGQLICAALVGHLAGSMLAWGAAWAGIGNDALRTALYGCGVGVAAYWCLEAFRRLDGKLFVYYLMHDYAYSARSRGKNSPELEARIAEFVSQIARALDDDIDEVLVVGHSSGAHLGVSVLADLLRGGHVRAGCGPALSFLTLGQVVPMVSFLPAAMRLRADLRLLCEDDRLHWVDVTAPGDGCAFALCDPVAVTGVATKAQRGPLVISAAFSQTLSPARWRALRWRFFRLHFQYLCAFDAVGAYDYFRITAGPLTLRTRFAARMASPSCKRTPVNKFTSVA